MKVYEYDSEQLKSKKQLFPDEICNDYSVAYHGTSSISELNIDNEGLCWNSNIYGKEDVAKVVSVFDNMCWSGKDPAGYPVLYPFSLKSDFRQGVGKNIYLAETSYRALLYASNDFCGGETARALCHAIDDLEKYLISSELKKEHETSLWNEYNELREMNALLPEEPKPVELTWLSSILDELSSFSSRLKSVRIKHSYGVVYAVKFNTEDMQTIQRVSHMGIEVPEVSPQRILGKVKVPSYYKHASGEDPHCSHAMEYWLTHT